MPTGRGFATFVAFQGKLHAIGGYDGAYLAAHEVYDPALSTWTAKAPMPTPRAYAAAAVLNGKIYVLGGTNGAPLSVVEEYDPATDTWATKASMPTPRESLAAAVSNGKLYAMGGFNGIHLAAHEEYDPVLNGWSAKAPMPTPRFGLAVAPLGGKIHALGGNNTTASLATHEVYDPAQDAWLQLAPMPTARHYLAALSLGGRIYAIGGRRNSDSTPLSTNEEYDPRTNRWTQRSALPTPRWGLAAASLQGRAYLAGGSNGTSHSGALEAYDPFIDIFEIWSTMVSVPTARNGLSLASVGRRVYAIGGSSGTYLGTTEEYDPPTSSWSAKAPMPTARTYAAVATVNGRIYVIGGTNGGYLATNEEYDPLSNTWSEKAPMPTPRAYTTAAALNGKIYVLGGYNGASYLATNEVYDPATNTWSSQVSMLGPRGFLAAAAVNGRIYALGGFNGVYVGANQEFDPQAATWTIRAPLPAPRYGLAAAAADGRVYALGGNNGTAALSENLAYDPGSDSWSYKSPMSMARQFLGAVFLEGKLYASGGDSGGPLGLHEEWNAVLPPYPPSGVSPPAAVWLASAPTLGSSGFQSIVPIAHKTSHWQMRSLGTPYAQPVWESTSTASLTSIQPAITLSTGVYFWRVRYENQEGIWSDFSDETYFRIDNVSPDPVGGLEARTGSEGGTLDLSWTVPGNNGSGGNLLGGSYEIFRSTDSQVSTTTAHKTTLAATLPTGASQSHTLQGVSPGVVHFVWVRAIDPALNVSPLSGGASAQAQVVAPGTVAVPFTELSSTGCAVHFSSGTPASGFNPTGTPYLVQVATSSNFSGWVASTQIVGLAATFSDFLPNRPYHARVAALNNLGQAGPFAVLGSTYTLAATPGSVSIGSVSSTTVSLSFQPNGNPSYTFYEISFSPDNFQTSVSTPISFSDAWTATQTLLKGLTPDTPYWVRVRAQNMNSIPTSFSDAASTRTVLGQVAGLQASTVGFSSITWSWNPVPGAQGYNLHRPSAPPVWISSTSASEFAQGSLQPDTVYGLQAGAENSFSRGVVSAGVWRRTLAAPPQPTPGPFSQVYASSLTFHWVSSGNPSSTLYSAEISSRADFVPILQASPWGPILERVFTGLSPGTTYFAMARAMNGDLIQTPYGGSTSTQTLPTSLAGLSAVALSSSSVAWSWLPSGGPATSYRVFSSTSGALLAVTSLSSFTLSGLEADTPYGIRVQPFTGAGDLPLSGAAAAHTWAARPAESLAVVISSVSIQLSWQRAGNPPGTRFEVSYSSVDAFGAAASVVTLPLTTQEFVLLEPLAAWTTYYARARALNGEGLTTPYDDVVVARTLPDPNSLPTPFALLFPSDGAYLPPWSLRFEWENKGSPLGSPVSFALHYSTRPDLSVPLAMAYSTRTAYLPLSPVEENIYYWRVIAKDEVLGFTYPSPTFQVTVSRSKMLSPDRKVYVEVLGGLPPDASCAVEKVPASEVPSLGTLGHGEPRAARIHLLQDSIYRVQLQDSQGARVEPSGLSAKLSFTYEQDGLGYYPNSNVPAEHLQIGRLEEALGRWEPLAEGSSLDPQGKQVTAVVSRFSYFALLGALRPSSLLSSVTNFPNPFHAGRQSTRIRYTLTQDARVTLTVYTPFGDRVLRMEFPAGGPGGQGQPSGAMNEVSWDGRNEAGGVAGNGMYVCVIEAETPSGKEKATRLIGVKK